MNAYMDIDRYIHIYTWCQPFFPRPLRARMRGATLQRHQSSSGGRGAPGERGRDYARGGDRERRKTVVKRRETGHTHKHTG